MFVGICKKCKKQEVRFDLATNALICFACGKSHANEKTICIYEPEPKKKRNATI